MFGCTIRNLRPPGTLLFAGALLVALCAPAFGQEEDVAARIAELEKALEAIKAGAQAGKDVTAKIAEFEERLAQLEADAGETGDEAASVQESAGAPPASTGAAEELPPAGVQGAPNPLQDEKTYLTGSDLLDESFPGSVPIPGTNVRFKVSGYAKLDAIQDADYVGDRFEFELATIAVEGTPEAALDGRTTLHAKETRVNFDFRSRARREKSGHEFPLQAFLELDFFDDRESFALQPRMRQAYGVIGRFLAGQTWTISGDLEALAGTIDFSGGDALYGGRVGQIRWQDRAGEHTTWAVGLEDPRISIGNPLGLAGEARPQLPNLGGKVRWTAKSGSHVQLGGDLFQLDWQGGDEGPSDREMGFGLNLTGRWVIHGKHTDALVGGVTIGRGSAHKVIVLSFDGGNDAVITSDGLDVMEHWQAYAGFSHYWTKSLNSTISTAWAELDNSPFQPGSAVHRGGSAHLNLIWFPYKLVSTGGEIMWGQRLNKDGSKGEAWRFQYMAKFKFN